MELSFESAQVSSKATDRVPIMRSYRCQSNYRNDLHTKTSGLPGM